MSKPDRSCVIRLARAQARIPGPAGEHSVSVLQRGTLDVKLSLPTPPNQQTPHAQDEVYVVIRGRGILLHDGERDPFESGDLLQRGPRRVGGLLRPSGRRGPRVERGTRGDPRPSGGHAG